MKVGRKPKIFYDPTQAKLCSIKISSRFKPPSLSRSKKSRSKLKSLQTILRLKYGRRGHKRLPLEWNALAEEGFVPKSTLELGGALV